MAIIRRGEIIAEGAPRELINADAMSRIRFRLPPQNRELLEGIDGVSKNDPNLVSIDTSTPTATLHELTRRAQEQNLELAELTVSRSTLEDAYLKLVEDPGAAP